MSWVQILIGQGILPQSYHPLVDQLPNEELARYMASIGGTISDCVDAMPMQQAFIDRYCAATPPTAV